MRSGAATLLCLLLAVCSASPATAGSTHRQHRPHRQALGGATSEASVPVTEAPVVGGKGGGVDPGDDYPTRWKNAPKDSVLDAWKEYNRECTSFVAWALHSRNGFEMPFYRNANRWGPEAQRRRYVVNSVPALGSVAWTNTGAFGHVAYVVAVNGANVTVEEYNFLVRGAYDKRVVSASAFTGFIHFKDLAAPPSVSGAIPQVTTPPTTPATTPVNVTGGTGPVTKTYAETAGGTARTWTDYTLGGGSEGPSIPSGMTVQIACALGGLRVEDGNTWWYRIASSPWSGNFYVTADAFYNNGATTGSLLGTPWVDPAVPPC